MLSITIAAVGFFLVVIGNSILNTIEDGSGKISMRIILSSLFVFSGASIVIFMAARMIFLYILPRLINILF